MTSTALISWVASTHPGRRTSSASASDGGSFSWSRACLPVQTRRPSTSCPASRRASPSMPDLTTDGPDDDALRGDIVRVHFTDIGGLTRKANNWLDTVEMPCRLRLGKTTLDVTVTRFAPPNDRSQFRVSPTIGQVLRAWGAPRL